MATIVNNPGTSDSSGSNNMMIGLVLLILLAVFLWFIGAPYLRGGRGTAPASTTNVENNVEAPEAADPQIPAPADEGDTNINVPIPDQVDVNVNDGDTQE